MAYEYQRVNWQDAPSTDTPISAANLNKMDEGIEKAHNEINVLKNGASGSGCNDFVVSATLDSDTGEISADKTYDEIQTAVTEGKKCYMYISDLGVFIPFVGLNNNAITFSLEVASGDGQFITIILFIDNNNNVSINYSGGATAKPRDLHINVRTIAGGAYSCNYDFAEIYEALENGRTCLCYFSDYQCYVPLHSYFPSGCTFSTYIVYYSIPKYIKIHISSDDVVTVTVNAETSEPAEDDIPKVFILGDIPTTKTDVLAEMEYVSKTEKFHAYLEIKCQGTSSLSYPKKNFTIKMYSDGGRTTKFKKSFKDWDHESNKYVLKANYIDHSHARNIVCARLWDKVVSSRSDYDTLPEELRNSPRNGAIDGFPIKVYTNGTYQGIYTWNIGKDDWMWGMDKDNPNHVLLCAETNTDGVYAENASNFRALWGGVDGTDWSVEVGTNSTTLQTSLNNLISFVMNNDGDDFRNGIGNYLDIQSAIDYYIFQYEICGLDGLAKNMLLATYDGTIWRCGAYDMDSTFGLFWNGGSFVYPEYACPESYMEQFSLLWERIEANFWNEFVSRQKELRETVLSYANVVTHFEQFMDIIGKDLYAEDLTIYPDIPSGESNNIKQIRDFVRDRQIYVDTEMNGETPDTSDRTLPEEYESVYAIQSNGNSWINTGVSGGTIGEYEIDFTPSSENVWTDFFGSSADDSGLPKYYANEDSLCLSQAVGLGMQAIGSLGERYKIAYKNLQFVVNDKTYYYTNKGYKDSPWYVFSWGADGGSAKMILYSLKMWKDGELVRDFAPCKRTSDGELGLWDYVSRTFLGNEGTGTFTQVESPDIEEDTKEYETITAIKSDGNSWINTGITGGTIGEYEIDFTPMPPNNGGWHGYFMGGADTSLPQLYSTETISDLNECQYVDGAWSGAVTVGSTTERVKVEYKDNKFIFNGSQLLNVSELQSGYGTTPWTVFAKPVGNDKTIMILYSLKMWNDSVLVRDFVPKKRINDGVLGLWDNVSETFFENEGAGSFTEVTA